MTVTQLIEELQKLVATDAGYANAEVFTEGCDCDGDVASVLGKTDGVNLVTGKSQYEVSLMRSN